MRYVFPKGINQVQKNTSENTNYPNNNETLRYVCNTGNTNLYKQLIISSEKVDCVDDDKIIFSLPLSSISSLDYSANFLKFNSDLKSQTIWAIHNTTDTPLTDYKGLSNNQAMKEIIDFFKKQGKPVKFKWYLQSKSTIIIIAVCLGVIIISLLFSLIK
jgi:hypothetical protein